MSPTEKTYSQYTHDYKKNSNILWESQAIPHEWGWWLCSIWWRITLRDPSTTVGVPRTLQIARQAPLSMGIFQARILECVAVPSSRGFSQPRNQAWAWQAGSLPLVPPGKPFRMGRVAKRKEWEMQPALDFFSATRNVRGKRSKVCIALLLRKLWCRTSKLSPDSVHI